MLHRSHTHTMQPTGRYQQKRISVIRKNSCTVNASSIFWSTTRLCGPRLPTQSSFVTSCPWPFYAKCLFLYRILCAHLNPWRLSISRKFLGLMDVGKLSGLSLLRENLLVIVRWSPARKTIFSQIKLHKKLPNCDTFWNESPSSSVSSSSSPSKILLLKMLYTKNNPKKKFQAQHTSIQPLQYYKIYYTNHWLTEHALYSISLSSFKSSKSKYFSWHFVYVYKFYVPP
jgi:hypothetical protein